MTKKQVKHILGLSGGKDSTALAILMHQEIPEMEYFFCDTHKKQPLAEVLAAVLDDENDVLPCLVCNL